MQGAHTGVCAIQEGSLCAACGESEALEKLKVFSYMFPTKDAKAIILVIEFQLKDDRLIQIIDDAKEVVGTGNVKTWPEFFSASRIEGWHHHVSEIAENASTADLELGAAEALTPPPRPQSPHLSSNDEMWIEAGKRDKIKSYQCETKKISYRRRCALKIRTEPCVEREFCSKYNSQTGQCTYLHTPAERVFFDTYGGRSPLKLLKKHACVHNKNCLLERSTCSFLHDGEPPLCKICLGTPCIGSARGCGPNYSRVVVNVDSIKYKDLLARNYIQRK